MPLEGKKLFWPIDVLSLGYNSSIILLILVFSHNLDNWKFLLFYNLLIAVVILFIVHSTSHTSAWQKFIRYFYPMILFTFLYEETASLVHIIFPKVFDYQINALEKHLLGVYPTVWLEKIVSVPLNEVMGLGYFSYYFLFPILGIALYLKKEYKVLNQFLLTIAVAFYILSPFILTLFVATVYCRFHYASDVVAGLLLGVLTLWMSDKIFEKIYA